ncbi:hypothetical protein H181DRAFT_02565 [Streptomyces sp. WMMB 714]|uniref:membrane protein n=1 Tax=Streptomyces sp. WMMB 714 TaxID=1286822 RepID=UPI0005F84D72|nr:membrane protein [Streptomyces sp. WMMB 714]SCK32096.1 hypothetical protein H181DRAFT_02565 [Streptomyces sp. WMMB 714]
MYVLPAAPSAPVTDRLRRLPYYGQRTSGRPLLQLGLVAAAYTLAQLLLVVPGTGLGWDETVYVSQVDGLSPASFFSAPRARGISYLVAPAAAFTSSTTVLRVFLALLSGAGLLAALWVWRRLLPVSVLAWGGALFAGLWISLFYGPQAMPNLWCGFGSLAAAGCFLRCVRYARDRAALAGLVVSVGAVALMRPPDAAWLVLALGGAALVVPGWRRPAVLGGLPAGALAGAAPWIVEAFTSYGGLFARLHRASEIQGGMGWNVAIGDHVRALQGRMLCRPCDMAWEQPQTALWWFALPLLAAAGITAAVRAGRRDTAVLASVTAVVLALPYLFLMGYAAPRFLLPSYALLALPVGECMRRSFAERRDGRRPLVLIALPALLLGCHLAVQYQVLNAVLERNHKVTRQMTKAAATMHGLGLRTPCTLTGPLAVPMSHYAGCSSRQSRGHDVSITAGGLRALAARHEAMAITVRHGAEPPRWARAWPSAPLSELPGYRVYVSPHGDRQVATGQE